MLSLGFDLTCHHNALQIKKNLYYSQYIHSLYFFFILVLTSRNCQPRRDINSLNHLFWVYVILFIFIFFRFKFLLFRFTWQSFLMSLSCMFICLKYKRLYRFFLTVIVLSQLFSPFHRNLVKGCERRVIDKDTKGEIYFEFINDFLTRWIKGSLFWRLEEAMLLNNFWPEFFGWEFELGALFMTTKWIFVTKILRFDLNGGGHCPLGSNFITYYVLTIFQVCIHDMWFYRNSKEF